MFSLIDYTALQDQSIAWAVYLAAAFVALLAYTQLTRRWWFELRWVLFALIAVFLLVPAPIPGRNLQAPAMIMIAFSPFTGSPELIAGVIVRLLVACVAALLFVILIAIIRRLRLRAKKASS